MESLSHRERYIANPLRLLRGIAEVALSGIRAVDDALAEFTDDREYNETNFPPITSVEAPVATEEELL